MDEHIFLTVSDHRIYMRFVGHMTALFCGNTKKEFRGMINNSVKNIYADFRDCEYMDSTFIGLLVIMTKLSKQCCNTKLVCINLDDMCRTLLESSGVLPLLEETKDVPNWPEIETEVNTANGPDTEILLESHKELSELSERNAEKFRLLQNVLQKRNNGKTN